jgi:predicted GNAT family N-acyltransferase
MQRFHEIALDAGLRHVWCNAQLGAAPFYAGLGYLIAGEEFEEASIPHVRMELQLR